MFVTKKGCLADYFDMEKIEDIYQEEGFAVWHLMNYEEVPLIKFFNGEYTEPCTGIKFDTYFNTENSEEDEVLKSFGPEAVIVTGLLYGYPIEMTMKMLSCLYLRRI